ncbi:MAG TPA: alpha/beta fold hydrolase [Dehalococcoidia bacterium]
MGTFVLIHGGWHGGWCWRKLVPLLQRAGHRALAPDLPGHGEDRTPVAARPWERYVPSVCDLLDAQEEPVILVGHSSGGMIISEVAARRPARVRTLVYLAAFLLPPGLTPPQIMQDDAETLLPGALVMDKAAQTVSIDPAKARQLFYADCSDADAAWALSRLQPEPLVSPGEQTTPSSAPAAVARVYVETLHDRALGPAMQKRMYAALPCERIFTLATDHSPFISAPEALAQCLLALV